MTEWSKSVSLDTAGYHGVVEIPGKMYTRKVYACVYGCVCFCLCVRAYVCVAVSSKCVLIDKQTY